MESKGKYDDIIGLPHHVSKTRPQMPMSDRAAQFAPFAALRGYEEAIQEINRVTEEKIELDEDALRTLNLKFQIIVNAIDRQPEVTITFFEPDKRKAGGAYRTTTGRVVQIKRFERMIILQNGKRIPMDSITDVSGDLFSSFELL